MPLFSVTVRSLALASIGFGAVPAFAQSANVTAFNPYNGVGVGGGAGPSTVYAEPQGAPAGGPAFNPWSPTGAAAGWISPSPGDVQAPAYSRGGASAGYDAGANLPPPPPGPIESRLTAIPQMGDRAGTTHARAVAPPTPIVAPSPPPPEPVVTRATPPEPVPAPPVSAAPPAAAPPVAAPPAAVVPTPVPPRPVASVAPPPPEPASPPAAPGPTLASVTFSPDSAEITGMARAELDRVAQTLKNVRQVELRAYAGGSDPTEARKVALARALSVRSYLIDQGVRARIEVGAFASSGGERVDVLGP